MKCNDCVPILSRWITESEVDLCPKHAAVDEVIEINKDLLAALKAVMKTMPPVEDVGWDDLAAAHAWLETLIEVEEALAKAEPKERGE